jgi:HAD superfamily hydrolase (TIGR01493 family)
MSNDGPKGDRILITPTPKCVAFDCFGTLFDMSLIPKNEIADYVRHVRHNDFTPYEFPSSWWKLKPHPGVVRGFEKIREMGIYVVALSNGSRELLCYLSVMSGIKWSHIVDLVQHQVYKPHRAAYLTIYKDLGIRPEDTLMVTANPTFGDIEGAASVGMRSQVIRHGHPNNVIELAYMLGAG